MRHDMLGRSWRNDSGRCGRRQKIIFRGDSGFCRWRMLRWCEDHGVHYVIGLAKNSRVNEMARPLMEEARQQYEKTGQKQRLFCEIRYAALTWDRERRVLVKAEHVEEGSNPRYVITNLSGDPQKLYDDVYCARGEMENRIKEQQLDLFADRTSCSHWWPNQSRLLLLSVPHGSCNMRAKKDQGVHEEAGPLSRQGHAEAVEADGGGAVGVEELGLGAGAGQGVGERTTVGREQAVLEADPVEAPRRA